MWSLRTLLPQVRARRTWTADGTPSWEFRFTSRRSVTVPARRAPSPNRVGADRGRPSGVHLVSSRGVQLGDDTLWLDEFHYGPARVPSGPGGPDAPAVTGDVTGDVVAALLRLAADPGDDGLNADLLAALARDGFELAPGGQVSAGQVVGHGVGRCLDGVFVWRAGGRHGPATYLVAPDESVRDRLRADPSLARAVVRAACPQPDDILGELEAGLREAITRLGLATGDLAEAGTREPRTAGRSPSSRSRVVLEVESGRPGIEVPRPTAGRSQEQQRALSAELHELARKVGTASVRPQPRTTASPAREAG